MEANTWRTPRSPHVHQRHSPPRFVMSQMNACSAISPSTQLTTAALIKAAKTMSLLYHEREARTRKRCTASCTRSGRASRTSVCRRCFVASCCAFLCREAAACWRSSRTTSLCRRWLRFMEWPRRQPRPLHGSSRRREQSPCSARTTYGYGLPTSTCWHCSSVRTSRHATDRIPSPRRLSLHSWSAAQDT